LEKRNASFACPAMISFQQGERGSLTIVWEKRNATEPSPSTQAEFNPT